MPQNYVSTNQPKHRQNREIPIIDNIEENEFILSLQLLNDDENQQPDKINEGEQQPVLTHQKQNHPFGDQLTTQKPANTIRIFLKNINGIKNYNSWAALNKACASLQSMSVDFIGITETNINWNKKIRSDV
jgi:hypothetical protein